MTDNATIARKAERRKPSLQEPADDLGNASEARRRSRGQFCEIRGNCQSFGSRGLLDRARGPRNPHPGRATEEQEKAVMDYRLEYPTRGALRASRQLAPRGSNIGARAIRGIWQRRELPLRRQRLLRLERHYRGSDIRLAENRVRLPERFDPEFRERHARADFAGDLAATDAFMAGNLKGIGKICPQAAADCHSRLAFGNLHTSKMPVTAARVPNDRALPFFGEQGCRVVTALADNGPECCGRLGRHPLEPFLRLEEIERRRTPARRPQGNGIAERLRRALLEERFKARGRVRFCESPDETQKDLDAYPNVAIMKGRARDAT